VYDPSDSDSSDSDSSDSDAPGDTPALPADRPS